MIKTSCKKLLPLILTFAATCCFAQEKGGEEAAVKAVVNKLFDGMRTSDTAMIRSVFSSASILQTIVRNREGKTVVLTEAVDSFLISISAPHSEVYDERISFETIRIDGDLALVWAPYQFYIGSKFSHCGIDSFQLVRINGEWKVQYLVDTRRRQGCL